MTPGLPQRLLNEHEVATTCAISVATLRKWRTLRRGPRFLKIGSLVRYRAEDIAAWIEQQEAHPAEPVEVAR
jgi:predicted DNA-binding transcriptional regulator AlpA